MDMIAHLLSSIALSKDRTLRITIRIETRKCDRNTERKGDRPQVILRYNGKMQRRPVTLKSAPAACVDPLP